MAVPKAVIAVPIGVAGIDTRTDPKAVAPPALAVCENGSFATPGRIEKRAGFTTLRAKTSGDGSYPIALSSITGATRLDVFEDQLLLSTADSVYTRNETSDRWDYVGLRSPFTVEYGFEPLPETGQLVTMCERAVTATMDVLAVSVTISGTAYIYVRVCDAVTGAQIIPWGSLFQGSAPQMAVVGDEVLLFTRDASNIKCTLIQADRDPLDWLAMTTTPITDLHASATGFCVAAAAGGAIVAYRSTTATTVKHGYVDASGALNGALISESTGAEASAVACAVEPTTGRFAVVWATSGGVSARMYTAARSAMFAAVSVGAHTSVVQLTCSYDGVAVQQVLHVLMQNGSSDPVVYHNTLDTSGTALTSTIWFRHSFLMTHAWAYSGGAFAGVMPAKGLTLRQMGMCVGRCYGIPAAGTIVGWFGEGTAYTSGVELLPHMQATADGFAAACMAVMGSLDALSGADFNLGLHSIDLGINDAGVFVVQGGDGLWSGAVPLQFDGRSIVENGFLVLPSDVTAVATAGAGLEEGDYLYKVYWEWYDARGRRHRSSTVPVNVTTTPGMQQVTLTIPTLAHTRRTTSFRLVSIVVYRSEKGGTICYRVSKNDSSSDTGNNRYVANDTTSDTVTFVDAAADADIIDNEGDYLSADPSPVDNIGLPAVSALAAGNNRIYAAGFLGPNEVRPSKLRDTLEALAFSDALTFAVDAGNGPITALGTVGDAVVIFRERQTYIVGGEGPDNTGLGGTFTEARTLSDDIGCTNARSVVRIPQGLMFQSRKGIYILAGEQLAYVGAPVEGALDGETITSAVALSDIHEVRFGLASGKTLVYHHLTGQWSTASYGGLGAVLWRNQYTYLADSTGTVRVEGETYTDDGVPYQFAVETPWIRLGAMQGFQLARRVLFMGSYRGAHRPRILIAYDFEGAWIDEYEWDPADVVDAAGFGDEATMGAEQFGGETGGLPATGVYQFQVWCSQPRCQAIKIRIEDRAVAGGGVMGDSFTLSEIAIEIAQKPGPMRLGAEKTA